MASVRQVQVTFDCANPERVARFWCEVLGYVLPPPPPGFATWDEFEASLPAERHGSAFACVDPTGAGPRLFFQRVPEPKTAKNRVHLDLAVGGGRSTPIEERRRRVGAAVERAVAGGATPLKAHDEPGEHWVVMQDPEGNEFCLH
jgi:catechol 2,3-dioxygenase-like lactoylglutathione lyase family enzyme